MEKRWLCVKSAKIGSTLTVLVPHMFRVLMICGIVPLAISLVPDFLLYNNNVVIIICWTKNNKIIVSSHQIQQKPWKKSLQIQEIR